MAGSRWWQPPERRGRCRILFAASRQGRRKFTLAHAGDDGCCADFQRACRDAILVRVDFLYHPLEVPVRRASLPHRLAARMLPAPNSLYGMLHESPTA